MLLAFCNIPIYRILATHFFLRISNYVDIFFFNIEYEHYLVERGDINSEEIVWPEYHSIAHFQHYFGLSCLETEKMLSNKTFLSTN